MPWSAWRGDTWGGGRRIGNIWVFLGNIEWNCSEISARPPPGTFPQTFPLPGQVPPVTLPPLSPHLPLTGRVSCQKTAWALRLVGYVKQKLDYQNTRKRRRGFIIRLIRAYHLSKSQGHIRAYHVIEMSVSLVEETAVPRPNHLIEELSWGICMAIPISRCMAMTMFETNPPWPWYSHVNIVD